MKDVVREEIEFARNRLKAAKLLLEQNLLADAVNRAYYAAFYAARAMLHVSGHDARTHAGVLSEFGLKIVRQNLAPEKYAKVLRRAFELRETSDYVLGAVFGKEEVETLIREVEDFLNFAEKFVQERL